MSGLLAALTLPLALAVPAGAGFDVVPLRGMRAEVAALLVQGRAGGALPIAAALFPPPAGGGVGFLLELETPAPGGGEATLEVYAYAVDGAGEVVAHFAATLAGWLPHGEGLKVSGRLQVPSGEISVRLLVWEPETRRYGMAVRRVGVGEAAIAVAVAEECRGWSTAGREATDLLGLSARPVLVRGESRRLALGAGVPPGDWRVRLARAVPAEEEGELVSASVTEGGELDFVVPDLPAGIYQLSAVESARGASSPVETWLVPALPPAP